MAYTLSVGVLVSIGRSEAVGSTMRLGIIIINNATWKTFPVLSKCAELIASMSYIIHVTHHRHVAFAISSDPKPLYKSMIHSLNSGPFVYAAYAPS